MRTSKFISIFLHPVLMPIASLYFSLKTIPSVGFAIHDYLPFIYLTVFLFTFLLPVLSLFFFIKKKQVSNLEISEYKERPKPLLVATILMVLGYYLLYEILIFSPIIKTQFLGAIIIVLLSAIISTCWKISLHMLGAGGVFGLFFSLHLIFGGLSNVLIFIILISGILGSARIKEKAHTHLQVYSGFLVGFFVESAAILFF